VIIENVPPVENKSYSETAQNCYKRPTDDISNTSHPRRHPDLLLSQ
jgi:hypothetical protein